MKPGISAIVVVRNQSELLKQCLDSIVNWVDQIVLIDLESQEDIASIANTYHAKLINHPYVPIVEQVRQESLKYSDYEYVIFLDPDETIPSELAADLEAKIITDEFDYFQIPRCNFVFGKWVKHSRWWPDLQTRVFRTTKVSWGTTLHAEATASGSGYTYPAQENYALQHQNYLNLDEFISKNMRYAKVDAQDRLDSGQPFTLAEATKLSISELISRFFAGEGYKDGLHGLILALLQSYYYFMVYAYYWEASKYVELEPVANLKSFPRTWFSLGLREAMHWDKAKTTLKVIKEKLVRRMIG